MAFPEMLPEFLFRYVSQLLAAPHDYHMILSVGMECSVLFNSYCLFGMVTCFWILNDVVIGIFLEMVSVFLVNILVTLIYFCGLLIWIVILILNMIFVCEIKKIS